MKKKGNVKKAFFNMVLPGLLLLALMVSLPAFAHAAGDAGNDQKIQAVRQDIMACMEPGATGQKAREAFAKKYNTPLSKLNEKVPARPPAGNGGWDYNTSYFFCACEFAAVAPIYVWEVRAVMDKYKDAGVSAQNVLNYCIDYSMKCDHYSWKQNCLRQHVPSCCTTDK